MTELPFPEPPLQANGIRLRPWREADVPAIVVGGSDRLVATFIPTIPTPYTEADARMWLAAQEPARRAGRSLELAIADAADDSALGSIAARVDEGRWIGRVGYWLTPAARGRGHTTTALRLLCEWLLETLHLGRIELLTDPDNGPSQRVAERCGFQAEGRLRSHWHHRHTGEARDTLIWSLLPGELRPATSGGTG